MKLFKLATVLLALFCSGLYASYNNIEACVNCSYQQKLWQANNYALKSSPVGVTDMHVIDLSNYSFQSFSVSKLINPFYPVSSNQKHVITLTDKPTPSDLISVSNQLISENLNVESASGSFQIPKNVLENAWEYVSCAYCANDMEVYIRNIGTLVTAAANIEAAFRVLGILATSLPSTYEISLESGGKARFILEVGSDGKLLLKIISIIDSNNNSVPAVAIGLDRLNVKLGGAVNADLLNRYLVPLGYYVPTGLIGRGTIRECPEVIPPGQPCR